MSDETTSQARVISHDGPGHDHDHDEHREGLVHDLPQMQDRGMVARLGSPMARRGVLGLFATAGLASLTGLGATAYAGSSTSGEASALDSGDIPEETGGPYPADGTNGPNVLTQSGIVRRDITKSFGSASGVAAGVPLTIALRIYDNTAAGITPYAGAAVYLWHCTREGTYSLYSQGITGENYLRGVQVANAKGRLTFTSIFPACYSGRWPHIHFEVYPTLSAATSASGKLRTSQIALPQDVCQTVYGSATGYSASASNLSRVSLSTDNVFSDGYSLQMASLKGSVAKGYTLRLNVPV